MNSQTEILPDRFFTEQQKPKIHSGWRSRKWRLTIYGLALITIAHAAGFFLLTGDSMRLQLIESYSYCVIGIITLAYNVPQVAQKFKDYKQERRAAFEDDTDPEKMPL